MNSVSDVPIGWFLKERKGRYSAEVANTLGLRRLEKIDFSGNIHLVKNKDTRTGMILIKKSDLVISGINVEKGAIAVYNGEEDILATIHYSSYSFDSNKIDIEYFKWFLKSDYFIKKVCLSRKSGIKTELKPKHFLSLMISLPSLDLQMKIRERLDSVKYEIEELCQLDHKNGDHLQKLRKAILQEAISGKLVPQDPNDESAVEILKKIKAEKAKIIRKQTEKDVELFEMHQGPYELPQGWIWCKLIDIAALITDGKHGDCENQDNSGYFFLSAKDIINGKLNYRNARQITKSDFEEVDRRTNLQIGDIVVCNTGGSIGKSAIVVDDENVRRTTFQKSVAVIKLFHDYLLLDYIVYQLKLGVLSLLSVSQGSAMKNLLLRDLNDFEIALPPLLEQKRIVEKVTQLTNLFDKLDEKIKENQNNSESLMKAVLKEAFPS